MSDYKRAYGRGYNAGSARRWPEHKPPYPPQEEVRALMEAAHKLRDCADHLCATIDPEDDWYKELSPGIEAMDAALVKVSEWLKQQRPPQQGCVVHGECPICKAERYLGESVTVTCSKLTP